MTEFRTLYEHAAEVDMSYRAGISFGRNQNDILSQYLELSEMSDLFRNVNEEHSETEVKKKALIIRDMVEIIGWSQLSIFPDDVDRFRYGEPLGQCMVTARLAKDYFTKSKIAEVNVLSGQQLNGPHIVLELPVNNKLFYLDLTPDQEDAHGWIKPWLREYNPYQEKIRLIPKDANEVPYQFVRYQEDDELAEKKSRPLDHCRVLKQMFAYRYQVGRYGDRQIEGFARDVVDKDDFADVHDQDIRRRLKLVEELTGNQQYGIQVGVINTKEFSPSIDWLWDATGLHGYTSVFVDHRGLMQQGLFYSPDQIVISNLRGWYEKTDRIDQIAEVLGRKSDKLKPLIAPNLLEQQMEIKGVSGPIFVS